MRIELRNGVIKGNISDKPTLLRELSRAVLDGEMNVVKVVGFSMMDTTSSSEANIMERSKNCMQTVPEIATRLSKLVFHNTSQNIASIRLDSGIITSSKFNPSCGGLEITPVVRNIPLMTLMGPVKFRLVLRMSHGFHSLDENVRYMRGIIPGGEADRFFPCQSEHNVASAFRLKVLLNSDGDICYSVSPDADIASLEGILNECIESRGWM